MTDLRDAALQYAHQNRAQFISRLTELIKIPSVSTDPDHKNDIHLAAQWLSTYLNNLGIEKVNIYETEGAPIVYGEHMKAGNAFPIIMIYGHYDVQPAEPLEQWESDPFVPSQKGDNLYGRGSSDMKGQVISTLAAVESAIKSGGLPVNVKFLFEGEEEIGSPNIITFLEKYKDMLKCDVILNPDSGMAGLDIPTITYGLRGLAYFELRVYGPKQDLHSGMYGGVVHNPAQALCELIAGMHDHQGHITLKGFYDKVLPLAPDEKQELAHLNLDQEFYKKQTGVSELWGDQNYTPVERIGAQPTLEINGLYSGFTGKGSKTVLPAWAMAKISMRLVPNQDPEDVHKQLIDYLEKNAPSTIRWELSKYAGGRASLTDRNSGGTLALKKALETIWGKPAVFKREGGSIPIVAAMQERLGINSVLSGFGLPDDNVHGPNEKLHLPTLYKGIDALIHFLYNLA